VPRGALADTLLRHASLAALAAAVALLALVVGYVALEARLPPDAGGDLLEFLVTERWDPSGQPPKHGIGHAWMATLLIVGTALAIAVPLALAIAVFLDDVAPPAIRAVAEPALQLLAGLPAVVFGFVGYVTLVPLFERWLPTGETIFCAAVVLALMILPYIAATAAESFRAVPAEARAAALGLGVSRWYVFRHVTLKMASPGVLAGIVLGLGRGLGETLAVLMLSGNSPAFPEGLFARGQPITALIATDLGESAVGSERYHALFAAGLLLMLIVIAINVAIGHVKRRIVPAVA
jgi:phosphate transport system permease protein